MFSRMFLSSYCGEFKMSLVRRNNNLLIKKVTDYSRMQTPSIGSLCLARCPHEGSLELSVPFTLRLLVGSVNRITVTERIKALFLA